MAQNQWITRAVIAALATASSFALQAKPVRTFADVGYHSYENGDDSYSAEFQHYFADQEHAGTYDEFGFLDTDSSVSAHYETSDKKDSGDISGEWFINNLLVGAGYHFVNADKGDHYDTMLKLGYLFNDNLILSATHTMPDEGDDVTHLSAEYAHNLNDIGDYIGFTATTDDEFDAYTLSADYYGALKGGKYIRAGVALADDGDDTAWGLTGAYYFTAKTDVNLMLGKDETYGIGAKHFINANVAISANYEEHDSNSSWELLLLAHF